MMQIHKHFSYKNESFMPVGMVRYTHKIGFWEEWWVITNSGKGFWVSIDEGDFAGRDLEEFVPCVAAKPAAVAALFLDDCPRMLEKPFLGFLPEVVIQRKEWEEQLQGLVEYFQCLFGGMPQRAQLLHQHIGAPPKPLVKKGDEVKKGALLAEAGGFVSAPVHSPTSGTVSAMLDISGPMGMKMAAVEITSDGKDEWGAPFEKIEEWDSADPKELKQRVADAGIVGMGGAAFPAGGRGAGA